MINRGGEKIYSLELENILSTYRGSTAAVIPDFSPVYGEEPVALYRAGWPASPDQRRDPTGSRSKSPCRRLPARIIFTRALPRTHNGKVSKQQLKTRLAESIITLSTEDKSEQQIYRRP
ncbi:hypothetical protein MJ579_14645 [Klebsiella pneumoniae]|nr:hypothetical protein MJ579_14645 [Klebsiella pneumoniae]